MNGLTRSKALPPSLSPAPAIIAPTRPHIRLGRLVSRRGYVEVRFRVVLPSPRPHLELTLHRATPPRARSDPLSDALSQPAESVTTPATSTAPDSRASDLFAAPFQSSTWTEPHVATDHAALERDSGVRGVLSGESDATREPTALNAQAPSFIPSFAIPSTTLPFGDDATSPESTRASVADLETAETGHEADPATSRAENSAKQEERPSLSVSTGGPEPSRSPSSASAYSPSTLRNLVAQSCQAGDLHRLQSLLAQQPDSEERFGLANSINSTTGIAPIHHAAKKGHVEVVRWLVEECGAIVGLEDADGETALHKACLSGRVETAEWLLAKEGTEVDGVDNDGWTVSQACPLAFVEIVS